MREYKYFTEEELKCKCGCEEQKMSGSFMQLIDGMRGELGFPFIVTSAYRCPEYNDQVSTTGLDGPHTKGKAIDIAVSYEDAFYLIEKAFEKGFTGIGVHQKEGGRFVHLDILTENRPRVWSY